MPGSRSESEKVAPEPGRSSYRPEVDGLRAVAVLVVLLYHAGVPGFTGGFVGVDVFFVISGYLITRLIVDELDGGRFSFARFYGRRARRLFPAMFATLAGTFGAGVLILSPIHLEELALSLVYTLLSLSNVLFWSLAGYFDTASELKPLLHTWSLGVEEQFYLLWPVSVFLAYRFRKRRGVLALVAVVAVASLAAAEWAAGRRPEAAFFLTPFRMCELALGGACLWTEGWVAERTRLRDALCAVGLALIAGSVWGYAAGQRFPGLAAMLPCAGAALVIVAGRGRLADAVLANRPAVGIGLISYSLYLVHWPLFTLWRYGRPAPEGAFTKVGLVVASIALATAMYFLVEQPFRQRGPGRRRLSDPAFGLACAGLALALVLPAVSALAARGWPRRVPERMRALASRIPAFQEGPFADATAQESRPFPAAGRRNTVIVGDSHGADLLTGLLREGSQVNYRLLHIQWFCQPVLGDRPWGEGTNIKTREIAASCREQGEKLRDNPELAAADRIVFASSWAPHGLEGLPATIDYLKQRYRARILLVGGRYFFADPSALLVSTPTIAAANERFDAAKGAEAFEREVSALAAIAREKGVDFLDLRPFTCDRKDSGWSCPLLLDDGTLLYWDFHHWTPAGAQRVARRLRSAGGYEFLF